MIEKAGAPWLSAAEAAELLHVTEGTLREKVYKGEFAYRYVSGSGQGGKALQISLHSLPVNAQIKYYERLAPSRPKEIGAGLDALSGSDRGKALEKKAALDAWKQFLAGNKAKGNTHKLNLAFVAEWNKTHKKRICESTLYRWEEQYRTGGVAALGPRYGDRKPPESKITDRLRDEFLALYLDQNQPTVAWCYEKLKSKANNEGWPEAGGFPCLKTFQRLAAKIPYPVAVLFREGEKAYEDKCEPSILRDYSSIKPNDIWVADHHQFDVAVLGPDGKVCFPWVSAWMDVRSRRLLGWHISLNPNTDTVLLSFHHAVEHRNYNLPYNILVDNGKDYRALDIAGGRTKVRVTLDPARITPIMSLLEIGATYTEPYNAKAKPIERLFRTVKEQYSRLFVSYRGGNVLERPERLQDVLKKPEGLITLDEFKKLFADWADAVYNENPHSGQGMDGRCPREVYDSLLATVRRASPEALLLTLMRTTKALTVRRHGIWYFDRWFRSDQLMMHQGEKVHARYHPDQIGILHIYDLRDKYLCRVESHDLVAWGATSEDHRAAEAEKKRLRKQTEQYYAGRSAVAAEPDHVKRVINRRKAELQRQPKNEPQPQSQVIEPVRIGLQPPKKERISAHAEAAASGNLIDIAALNRAKEEQQKAAKEAERLRQEEQERLILTRINAKAR
ncbi:MAG: Mu transposase C-terminal domain-containing protein [Bacillota bacterium]